MDVTIGIGNLHRIVARYRIRRTSLYPKATRDLVKDVAIFAKKQAIRQSSFRDYVIGRGRTTLTSERYGKRRAGPYSKRLPAGSGPTADSEINIQSMEYVKGWYIQPTTGMFRGGSVAYGLGNRAPHAKYLHTVGGAGWMRERRILKGITQATRRRALRPRLRNFHTYALGKFPTGDEGN